MLVFLAFLVVQTVAAVSFPPPIGPYHVGYTQHLFNKTIPNSHGASLNASSFLLATIYYPTLTVPIPGGNTAPYLDPTTAKLWGNAFQFPEGSLQNLTTWNVLEAPFLSDTTYGVSQKPTIIFSPGAGENAIMYNALNSELASQGYTVVAIDHPGEAPYLQLPDGLQGVYGIDINLPWNLTLATLVYKTRISDILSTINHLFPTYVSTAAAPFNTTHYLTIGHSLGGAAAIGALALTHSVLGGVNLDGVFIESPISTKKPVLLLGSAEHTSTNDPSWPAFSANQSGWFQWLNVAGAEHQNFADLGDWVDLQGLRNLTNTPSLGAIWGPRMDFVVKTLVGRFFEFVLGEKKWVSLPEEAFPEVEVIDGSTA